MIGSSSAGMARVYYTIKNLRRAGRLVTALSDGVTTAGGNIGSFVNDGDNRHSKAHMRHSYSQSRNSSTSFCRDTLTCTTCTHGEHTVLHKESDDVDVADLPPQVFVVTDQNFPAVVPVEGNGECFKIIRIEDGTLSELVDFFLEITKGFTVPAGSVVILSSASFLAWVGVETYAAEFVKTSKTLTHQFGEGVICLHGIPILLGGTTDPTISNSLAIINRWSSIINAKGRDIFQTRTLHQNTLCSGSPLAPLSNCPQGSGSPLAPTHETSGSPLAPATVLRLRLPSSMTNMDKATFEWNGLQGLTLTVQPVDEATELKLLSSLLEELNRVFSVELGENISTERLCEEQELQTDESETTHDSSR